MKKYVNHLNFQTPQFKKFPLHRETYITEAVS